MTRYEEIKTELSALYERAYRAVCEGGVIREIEARIAKLEAAANVILHREAYA